jgi:hypothetical protein
MRTTIELNDEVFRAAKRRAAEQKKAFREIVEEALRSYLTRSKTTPAYRFTWHTERGALRPGVDLDDRDALWDVMEGRR